MTSVLEARLASYDHSGDLSGEGLAPSKTTPIRVCHHSTAPGTLSTAPESIGPRSAGNAFRTQHTVAWYDPVLSWHGTSSPTASSPSSANVRVLGEFESQQGRPFFGRSELRRDCGRRTRRGFHNFHANEFGPPCRRGECLTLRTL
ncbi:hypothetical protein PF008_g28031 [Phytophthora fragariae]|uniref:Uncharacterized protein n=1 Tax=Phytophthora fragariae TaxID=53985 RepID=A0A6G0QCF9_9STRA|nr:hypothetical protein PF008_g28031 [Phytophthora fragariae]